MTGTILITVKRHEEIEEIIPLLKNAVKAGTRVVFLVRYHVSSFQLCCLNYVETLQLGASAALSARYSWLGTQTRLLEHRISAACEVLSSQGIAVIVHPYTGRLRKAIRKYTAREDVQLIMIAKGAVPKRYAICGPASSPYPVFQNDARFRAGAAWIGSSASSAQKLGNLFADTALQLSFLA